MCEYRSVLSVRTEITPMLLLLMMYTAQKCARSAQKVGRLGGSTVYLFKLFKVALHTLRLFAIGLPKPLRCLDRSISDVIRALGS